MSAEDVVEIKWKEIQAEKGVRERKRSNSKSREGKKDKKLCLTSFICGCCSQIQLKLLFLVFSFQEPNRLVDFLII